MAYFLSPALAQLRAEVNAVWPHRDKTSDGWIGDPSHQARPSDHNPDYSDGGIVRALDIDEDLVTGLAVVGEAMPLVNQIIRDVRTRYVIYEGRIWTRENGWRPYSGVNAHRHHIHVSVRKVGNYDRDASPWGIARAIDNPAGDASRPDINAPIGSLPAPVAPITKEGTDMFVILCQVPGDRQFGDGWVAVAQGSGKPRATVLYGADQYPGVPVIVFKDVRSWNNFKPSVLFG